MAPSMSRTQKQKPKLTDNVAALRHSLQLDDRGLRLHIGRGRDHRSRSTLNANESLMLGDSFEAHANDR